MPCGLVVLVLLLVLEVEVEGEIRPEGADDLPISVACVTSHASSKAGNESLPPRRTVEGASAMTSSAGGESRPVVVVVVVVAVEDDPTGGGSLAASSAVDGFGGRFSRSCADESSESTAKWRNRADRLLTHRVHRYSAKRVR